MTTTPKADNRPVGIFDSGLGGLTVVSALMQHVPDEDILYLGDTARVPYGDKSADTLQIFAAQDADFLIRKGVKLLVTACNTLSAVALPGLIRHCAPLPVIGVIDAGCRAAVRSGAGRVAVIGTRCTVNSGAYRQGIHALDRSVIVESIACPLLVPLAEEGITSGPVAESVLDIYLKELRQNPPDALLLACTHYPLFRKALNDYFGGKVKIIDSAESCAEQVTAFLKENHLSASPGKRPSHGFFVTDLPSEFGVHAERFLGRSIGRVDRISLTP